MSRYLVITELFLPTKGGTAVWFDEVYRRLGGRHTHIVTAAVPGDVQHDAGHPATLHRLDLRRVPWLRPESLLMYLRLFLCSLWLALSRRFTAIHAGRVLPEGLVGLGVARITSHRIAIYVHGEELTTWGRGRKYKAMCFALRHADLIIANSRYTRSMLLSLGVPAERIELVNPGVDLERFRPGLPAPSATAGVNLEAGRPLLLSVGRLSRRKGFDQVIRCLSGLAARGLTVEYVIVGTGEDEAYLRQLAADCGVGAQVHFAGHVSAEDLPRWYCASDLFLMPNREIEGDTEGFGMVFLEAAACGRAAIAGEAGGTEDAVLHDRTGLRVDGASLPAVEEAIHALLIDPVRMTALAENGLQRARESFGWDAVARRIDSLVKHS
ncbi:MAG: hypothetical protein RL434_549 [Pseudomonadota bacterium]|jgi:phosphatidylinositol alpha-1,6-mannosyltransferase